MGRAKIAITVEAKTLLEIDRLVGEGVFPNRSKAFEGAIQERLTQLRRSRLARECAKLDRAEEQSMADEE